MRALLPSALILLLAGCGATSALKPKTGQSLPVAPYGSEQKPTAEALLKPTSQAAPERSVELRKRSEERVQDPFDLPPAD